MLRQLRPCLLLLAALLGPAVGRAGLYYSGETYADLPSQWRGFLLDQRTLRRIAVRPPAGTPANPARARYEAAAVALEKRGRARLSADDLADLGALYVRLGDIPRALDVLRLAQREHGRHFRVLANLGTAWQLQGDLERAAAALEQAVALAPGKWQRAEEYHLKLVRLRQREAPGAQGLDDLFGVRYGEPGTMAAAERKKLPADAAALVQQLALWLPADGRLLWQLAELASAHGDVRTAAAILDGCVTEFGMRDPELRRRRQVLRTAADALAKDNGVPNARAAHENHVAGARPRSARPLVTRLDDTPLPPISPTGVNPVPWSVLTETRVDRNYRPTFGKYLQELNGKQIALTGYMQPLGDDPDLTSFMLIEYPVGCWYCEMPEITGIVLVELPPGKTKTYTRDAVKVVGTLRLNATDPENFLYTIGKARVTDQE